MIGIEQLVSVVIYLIVAGLILWLLHSLIGYCGLPEPFAKVAKIILAVFAVLVIISVLLSLIGRPIIRW